MNATHATCIATLVTATLALPSTAADPPSQKTVTMEEHFEEVANLLAEQDSFAAAQYLQRQGSPSDVMTLFLKTTQWLHYNRKNVPGMIAISQAGIHYGLTEAERVKDANGETADKLRGTAKAISFNLAANTWPGWDDEGIVLTQSDYRVGLDAARLNLRLAIELKRDPLPVCNAHWLLGVHQIVAGDESAAATSLEHAIEQAQAADREDYEFMCRGYAAIAALHASPDASRHRDQLDHCVSELKRLDTEDSRFFADQLVSVHKVLVQPPDAP